MKAIVAALVGVLGCHAAPPASSSVDGRASIDGPSACDGLAAGVCAGAAGTFHDQPIVVGGETRYFFLHVPASAVGGTAAPLLFDYHGTGFTSTEPEEEWGTDELIATSDALGFVVVRPRSHSYMFEGQLYYQWDLDAADLAGTLDLTTQLIALIGSHYAIDANRTYVSGFSNGTNMALQTLQLAPNPFHGIGLVGGGIYNPFTIAPWADPVPRIYDTSGYRDLNYEFERDMKTWLAANGHPAESLWIRETKAIHELRGWQYSEMFGWLDAGVQPPVGTLASGWTAESFPSTATSLLTAARAGASGVIATGHDGSIWSRGSGGWTASKAASGTPVLIGTCLAADGTGYATGEAQNFTTADGGATWQSAPAIPLAGNSDESSTELFGLECGGSGELVGGGSVVAAHSSDSGTTWATSTPEALIFTIRRGASGVWLAIGPNYIARSTDGVDFTPIAAAVDPELYDAAEAGPGHWWAVGVDGAMMESTDDGVTWKGVTPIVTGELYAVRFATAQVGAAVGANGTAIVTSDGGATWQAKPAGVDEMLGDLAWLDSGHAVVIGERGLVLDLSP